MNGELCIADQYAGSNDICGAYYSADCIKEERYCETERKNIRRYGAFLRKNLDPSCVGNDLFLSDHYMYLL